MSYILDALKKSEQDRGNGSVPGVQTVHSSSLNYHQEKAPVWPWILIALIGINLAAIIYFIQSKDSKESVATIQPGITVETPAEKEQAITSTAPATMPIPSAAVVPTQKETVAYETQTIQEHEPVEPVFETVDLYDLPLNVRQHIPAMEFSAHVYSTNPMQRSLVINGRFMEEGSQINNELVLTEITSDGAVFDFQGYRFSTSVLSGWN
jgi:general secretion pathway protein B